jgi:hypothetical protein
MAAIVEKAQEGEWRDQLVKPAKDTRVQTEVIILLIYLVIFFYLFVYLFIYLFIYFDH